MAKTERPDELDQRPPPAGAIEVHDTIALRLASDPFSLLMEIALG
jgi:hypothetical protein